MKRIMLRFLGMALALCLLSNGAMAETTDVSDAFSIANGASGLLRLLASASENGAGFSEAPDAAFAWCVLGGYACDYGDCSENVHTEDELSDLYGGLFAQGAFSDIASEPCDAFESTEEGYAFQYGGGEPATMVAVNDAETEQDGTVRVDLSVWQSLNDSSDGFSFNAVAVLVPDENALFGAKALSFARSTDEPPVFNGVTADATLDEQYGNDYVPGNAIDGDMATCWAYTGSDTRPSLRLTASEPQKVRGLTVTAGYAKNEDIFQKNCRLKQVQVELSDGTVRTFDLDEAGGYNDVCVLPLKCVCETDEITLTVTEVYGGAKYDDVCVSEITVF